MPRLPINYDKTHFYKIVSNDLSITDCYVGCTTDFKTRKSKHNSSSSNEIDKQYNSRVYQLIREKWWVESFRYGIN